MKYIKKWVEAFLLKYNHRNNLGQKEINDFLTELAVKKHVSPSTQNQALASLLFYFRFVKNENPVELASVIHAKKKERIPVVFSRQEVVSVINNLIGSKNHRTDRSCQKNSSEGSERRLGKSCNAKSAG